MDDNGTITKPTWFYESRMVNTLESAFDDIVSWRPQHIYYVNTVPNTLMVRRVFTMGLNGVYTCAPTNTSRTRPSADNITLTAEGEISHECTTIIVIHSKDIYNKNLQDPTSQNWLLGLEGLL